MNTNIELKDFKSICRFCLEKEPYMKHIYLDNNDDIDYGISGMIEFCLGIKVLTDDKLPKFLCNNCYKELLNCDKFHKKCIIAEKTLKNILKKNDKQSKQKDKSSVVTATTPIKIDPLDFNCTEHTDKICLDSINEPTVEIKEENVNEWTETESNHIEENIDITKCGEIIIDESDIHDINDIDNDYSNNIIENDSPSKDNKNPLNCKNDEKIKKEKRKRKQSQCPICGKLFACITAHMETHSDIKKHICPHCNKHFSTKNNLNEHINGHFDLRPHKCKHCDRSFNSRKCLNIHNLWHNKEEKYECNICGRKFVYESTYRYHLKVHNQIKKYKCDICSREFITNHDVKKHYRVHTGERPYKCKECDKSFKTSYSLSEHRKVHTKEISHYCNKCNAGFVYKSTLNNHLKKCQ